MNNNPGRVSPAMKAAASNWNKFAKQFAERFRRQLNEIRARIVTEEKCQG